MNSLRKLLLCAVVLRRALISFDCARLVLLLAFLLLAISDASAQTTAFTYQGKLADNGSPANGSYDMQFKLFDSADIVNGNQVGSTINKSAVMVANGIFTVELDFGAGAFSGAPRFLEIGIRPAGSPGGYQQLLPRQPITSAPYALRSQSAANADQATNATTATQLGGIAASQYVVTTDSRLSDARPPTAGSTNYIQNTTTQQASTNFNIGGNAIVGGNLGIGTTAPGAKLHINGVDEGIRLQGPATGNPNLAYMSFRDSAGTRIGYVGDGSSNDRGVFLESDAGDVALLTTAGRVLTATSTGRVAIGTTDPLSATVHVRSPDTDQQGVLVFKDNGIAVAGAAITSGIGVHGQSPGGNGVYGTSSSGNGVFGTSSSGYAGYFQGNVYVTGSITQNSDVRLKQGVNNLCYGLLELLRLRPVTWRWRDRPDRELQLGLIAQEVEPVLPELVTTDKDAEKTKGLNYTGLLPVVIKAIQEQQTQIEQQQREIETLKRRQQEFEALKRLVCADHPNAGVCKSN